ncbi:hypothetical protein JR316_0005271 [Psilocybe cubensis]|uniref:Uncharacterized protein n=2 Tax=Psilocybe cubensis TaxID=181762 RepID=A0A8H7Y1Y3_PSICU|nr:hypothetical protein JR316_0005271 [Psilocybe cubensis]KAH9483167.1 hypothetical protein JR316_0005271 [Psilocybe cubensis]
MDKEHHPSIFIFNVLKAGARHVSDAPHDPKLLLAAFSAALESALNKPWIVQGAIYAPAGASIFIDTEDDQWHDHVGCPADEDLRKMFSEENSPLSNASEKVNENTEYVPDLTSRRACASIFKVPYTPYKSYYPPDDAQNDPKSLLKQFIDAIHSVLHKSELIISAMYEAEAKSANIFMMDG